MIRLETEADVLKIPNLPENVKDDMLFRLNRPGPAARLSIIETEQELAAATKLGVVREMTLPQFSSIIFARKTKNYALVRLRDNDGGNVMFYVPLEFVLTDVTDCGMGEPTKLSLP